MRPSGPHQGHSKTRARKLDLSQNTFNLFIYSVLQTTSADAQPGMPVCGVPRHAGLCAHRTVMSHHSTVGGPQRSTKIRGLTLPLASGGRAGISFGGVVLAAEVSVPVPLFRIIGSGGLDRRRRPRLNPQYWAEIVSSAGWHRSCLPGMGRTGLSLSGDSVPPSRFDGLFGKTVWVAVRRDRFLAGLGRRVNYGGVHEAPVC